MAIKQVRQVPNDFPPAHLFLDDIEEIVEILTKVPDLPRANIVRSAEFRVEGRVCDSLHDLKEIGGKTRSFGITTGYGTLEISRDFTYFNMNGDDYWKEYAQIRAVFQHRAGKMDLLRRGSVVELRYFDEARSERRKELWPQVWLVTLTAVVTIFATILGERIFKWLWP
jgi:hypothetical protein